ncbi:hypothetical protein [Oceanospirillum multiglobuliferum]|uniref:Uncharacterized protein n=1 Tax=Oceanospirillum multiglobuliferum TaxID=64969 RepID=A0A1V4T1Q5_9GAMM|nr:hypothetical protein [Oceanospirillum multiglobuliferum]OPX54088.1 hypothetical protein BTE48_16070 [Oceanospirillum multiglobuliferum]
MDKTEIDGGFNFTQRIVIRNEFVDMHKLQSKLSEEQSLNILLYKKPPHDDKGFVSKLNPAKAGVEVTLIFVYWQQSVAQ